ncbi:MAG: LysR family transcriptional regulator [Pseudomonadota bacterium]|nr:LysR family transcriptional regulator [Pseudomonadota bacterium]
MNIRNFDLNLLMVFKTLYEEKNVTRASKKMGITQPAMSNALNRLRFLVKDELFIRGPKGMRPTPRAIDLSLPIQTTLNNLEISLSSIDLTPQTTKKLYRISMSDDIAPIILPNLVNFIEKKSPNSSLSIRSEQGNEALKLLDHNEIDFAVGRFETVASRFGCSDLFTEEYVCIMRMNHYLANEEKLTIDQYLAAKHLRVAPMEAPLPPIDRSLSQLDLEREISVRIDLITLAPVILKNADLILTLPSKTAQRMAKNYGFRVSQLPIDLEKRRTRIVWHRELTNHPTFDWIKDQIRTN